MVRSTVMSSFKYKLSRVFDDNLETVQWKNILDYTIMALILLSTVEVFLSTYDNIVVRYGNILHFVDIFTTIFFTIEVTLRIWCADILDSKYKGFRGRIRYCFSFYGLIDILSTYTFYVSFLLPANYALFKSLRLGRVLRIFRLLRIFRYMRSIRILEKAIKSCKTEMMVSLQFLIVITVILSFVLFFVEHEVQPDVYDNGFVSVLWAFAQYIGDPGGFADTPPITSVGHVIAFIIGILGVAIFAVPAGLMGSAFSDVMEEENHEKELQDFERRIICSFKFVVDQQHSHLFHVPRYVPLSTIVSRKFITEVNIMEVVSKSDCLHLYNMAQAVNSQYAPDDKVVVVNYLRNTPYGTYIDRGSRITIVSTSGFTEPLTSWFAYHVAKIGGFNYVAKEVEVDSDNPVTYYNITNEADCPNLHLFLDDINRLTSRENSWMIPMLAATGLKDRPTDLHFCYATKKHDHSYDDPLCTISNTEAFEMMYQQMESTVNTKFGLHCDKNDWYVVKAKENIARHVNCQNSFTLRVECRSFVFSASYLDLAKSIAEVFATGLEPERPVQIPEEMLTRRKCHDFGMTDYIN